MIATTTGSNRIDAGMFVDQMQDASVAWINLDAKVRILQLGSLGGQGTAAQSDHSIFNHQ